MKKTLFSVTLAALCITGCGDSNSWTVNGTIDGGAGKTIVLEAADNGTWYPVDSTTLDSSGKYSMSEKNVGYPDIYRLNLDGQAIYFPIDSIETVTVNSSVAAFSSDYTLSGSTEAEMLMHVDNSIRETMAHKGEDATRDSILKRELGGMLLGDPAGIVAYYIINRKVGNRQLYDPSDKNDLKIIGAVANAFNNHRPNDPRTGYLKRLFLANRRAQSTSLASDTIYVSETPLLDIKLSDNTGHTHSLTQVASKHRIVILNFTMYNVDASPAFNMELARIYEKRHLSGLEIYQVSVDDDEFQWKQSAKNLPWITVYNSKVDGATNLLNYNVAQLPATFIICDGEVVARVDDITGLDSALDKYMK
ncbi:MAG: DUF4369 domain-containing protein [Muribaculaceae bacterium]|nr:DUF4369 domain-containing protein [Muribaculaceae bacterium]